jgi:hypothetical protein
MIFLARSGPLREKNISIVLSFQHKRGKPCGKNRNSYSNSANFNAMVRFALFLCIPSRLRFVLSRLEISCSGDAAFTHFRFRFPAWRNISELLVPLRRAFQMNLNGLLRIVDVVPVPVWFPSVRNDLNFHSSHRRIGYVSGSILVGLHLYFKFFVFY